MRGILTVLSQGCKWRAIDQPEAAWNSIYQYYRRWTREGVWRQLFSGIELPLAGGRRFLDSTHVKVHRCASNPCGGQASQAMGRTKGGMNTKIHALVDELGQPIRLLLSAGNNADISHAKTLAAEVPAKLLVADKGYDSDEFRQWLREQGIAPCIPPRAHRKQARPYSKRSYRKRHASSRTSLKVSRTSGVWRLVTTNLPKPSSVSSASPPLSSLCSFEFTNTP